MRKFYGNMVYVSCGNGCDAKLQKLLLNEQEQPIDVDWDNLRQVYDGHNSNCTTDSLFIDDSNAFYGNPDECTGFVVESDPDSGYKYCEFE